MTLDALCPCECTCSTGSGRKGRGRGREYGEAAVGGGRARTPAGKTVAAQSQGRQEEEEVTEHVYAALYSTADIRELLLLLPLSCGNCARASATEIIRNVTKPLPIQVLSTRWRKSARTIQTCKGKFDCWALFKSTGRWVHCPKC